jgi:CBS domain-containing protein
MSTITMEATMNVGDGMSDVVLTVGPNHTLRAASAAMCRREVGAAVVLDPDQPGPGVITERDILIAIGEGQDPDAECVCDHLTPTVTFAAADWPLERAAAAMVRGQFRHLVVIDDRELVGIISMRDIVRCWTATARATSVVDGGVAELAVL